MRPLLVLLLLGGLAFAGCTDDRTAEETPTQEPRSAGRPIGSATTQDAAGAPANMTRRVLDSSYTVTLNGAQALGGVYLNDRNCVRIGENLEDWIPAHLNITATWDAGNVAAERLALRVRSETLQDSVTGSSPLVLELTAADVADGAVAIFMQRTDPSVTLEQDVRIDVRLAYDAVAAAQEDAGGHSCG